MKKLFTTLSFIVIALTIQLPSYAQICFDPKVSYPTNINSKYICKADFNGDSIIDIAVTNSSSISILLGNGNGGFGTALDFPVGALPGSLCAADFNGDGKTDLASANGGPGNVSVLLGDGAGSFTADSGFGTGIYNPAGICSADVNGDHNVDLIISTGFNYLLLALGNGNGGFNAPTHIAASNSTGTIIASDFNGDGMTDLAVTTYNGTYHVSLLFGNGTGGFTLNGSLSVGDLPVSIISTDLNRDGKTDIATANSISNTTGNVSVFLGNGSGSFSTAVNFGIGDSTVPKALCSADYDGDSIIDLAVGCVTGYNKPSVKILKGDGLGGFAAPIIFNVDSFPISMVTADLNTDGKMDIAVSTCKTNIDLGNLSVLLNCNSSGIDQLTENGQFNVYPNPGKDRFVVNSSSMIDEIRVNDMLGRTIIQRKTGEMETSFQLEKSGVYIVAVTSGKKVMMKKLIVSE